MAPSSGRKRVPARSGRTTTTFQQATEATSESSPQEAGDSRKDELEPLSQEELSKKYGLGFALLQRMGYSAGAPLAPGALVAPLAAKANPGRQGLTEEAEPEAQEPDPSDLTGLLDQTLRSMREAGDLEEAEELQRLASFCGGGLEGNPLPKPKRRRPRDERADDGDALAEILRQFRSPEFPAAEQQLLVIQSCSTIIPWGLTSGGT
ncbi:unnamed protein product [Durusdinium trenchii]|uniref:G-patch domain-containing protein n=1 Tax=Durusdinium trenchii TaxID=1381693 RepID=A0ABP0T229_9DINO